MQSGDQERDAPMASFVLLDDRGVLAVAGEDRVSFLQGLTSNDIRKAAADRVLFSAFLTPQGKYLHDFFIVSRDGALLLECEAARRDDLLRRLRMYKLRSKVVLSDETGAWVAAAAFGEGALAALGLAAEAAVPGVARPFAGGFAYVDPRLAVLGARLLLPREGAAEALAAAGLAPAAVADYDRLRLDLGVPDGSRDLAVEKAILLESNFDDLNAIAWDKGCYMGQELTARTRYRGLVKKRLVPVAVDGPLPEPGTPVTNAAGRDLGEMRSGRDGRGLALLRLDALAEAAEAGPLTAGGSTVTPRKPGWVRW